MNRWRAVDSIESMWKCEFIIKSIYHKIYFMIHFFFLDGKVAPDYDDLSTVISNYTRPSFQCRNLVGTVPTVESRISVGLLWVLV